MKAQSRGHGFSAPVFDRQRQPQLIAGQRDFLPREVRKRPCACRVLVFECQSIVIARGHRPGGLPAVPVLGMRLRPLVERELDSSSPEDKLPISYPVRKRHQRKACEAVGGSGAQVVCGRRTQPVMSARPIVPMKMRDGAADAGRNSDAGAIRSAA